MSILDKQSNSKSDISPFINNITQIWKRRKFIFWNTFSFAILSILISLVLPKWYASKATIISSGGGSSNFLSMLSGLPMGDFGLSALNEDISSYIAILESRAVRENVVRKFNLIERYESQDVELAMDALGQNVELKVSEEGSLVITVFDKDPVMAKNIADELIIQLDDVNKRLGTEKGYFNRTFLGERLEENRDALKIAEDSLKAFQNTFGIIDIPSQVTYSIEIYAQLYAGKVEADIQYKSAQSTYTSNDPKILQLKNVVSEYERLLQNMTKIGDEDGVLVAFNDLPELGLEYVRLYREVELQSKIMELLVPQYEQARMDETKTIPTLQIIDKPYVALNKSKPQRSLIVMATTFMAFFLSILYILFEYKTREIRRIIKNN